MTIYFHSKSKSMEVRPLTFDDVDSMWIINEQGLPGTGQVSKSDLGELLNSSILSIGAFEKEDLTAFVICLPPGTDYGSLNYAWFNKRFDAFLYVDRIAVSKELRSRGIGTMLYEHVVSYSIKHNLPVAAEVNLKPPNPGSMRFHSRFNFEQIGTLQHEDKAVTMLMRKVGD